MLKVSTFVDRGALCALTLLIVAGPVSAKDRATTTEADCNAPHHRHQFDKNNCEQLTGPFTSVAGVPCSSPVGLCTHGTLKGDLEAQYDFTFETLVPANDPLDPYKYFYTGTSKITANDGTLSTHDTGVIHMLPDNQPSPFVTTATVIDGTGKYKKRRGEFVATGELVFGNATGSYVAEICKTKE